MSYLYKEEHYYPIFSSPAALNIFRGRNYSNSSLQMKWFVNRFLPKKTTLKKCPLRRDETVSSFIWHSDVAGYTFHKIYISSTEAIPFHPNPSFCIPVHLGSLREDLMWPWCGIYSLSPCLFHSLKFPLEY